jgi:hypothetical protein
LKDGIAYVSSEAMKSERDFEPLDEKGRRSPCCEFFQIIPEFHDDDRIVQDGWEAYYKRHPEQRRESEEVEFWEKKLGVE